MKTLILIRHAESSWSNRFLNDRLRPLSKIGQLEANWIGPFLLAKKLCPSQLISSPAVRAMKTAERIAHAIGIELKSIKVSDSIYLQGTEGLTSALTILDPKSECSCIIGHNPDLTTFTYELTGRNVPPIPTAGVIAIEFESNEWPNHPNGSAKLVYSGTPP